METTQASRYARRLAVALGLTVVIAGTGTLRADDAADARAAAQDPTGIWNVQVTVRNCDTGAALAPAFPTMLSFHAGGTLTSADTAFNPALRSPGLGVWKRTRPGSFLVATFAFLFTPAGAWNGTHRIVQMIELSPDGDAFSGNAAVQILDRGGAVSGTGCSTSTAQRIVE